MSEAQQQQQQPSSTCAAVPETQKLPCTTAEELRAMTRTSLQNVNKPDLELFAARLRETAHAMAKSGAYFALKRWTEEEFGSYPSSQELREYLESRFTGCTVGVSRDARSVRLSWYEGPASENVWF